MKTIQFIYSFSNNIENVISKIYNSLNISEVSNGDTQNTEIYKILENPKDEFLINETIEFLKKHKEIKEKEISLSNNNSLTISLE